MLPDLLRPGLRLVLCGSAPGGVSARRGAYYAGPGNKFWDVLHRIGLTPRRFAPEEFPRLLELGIGLTDLCTTAAGADADIPAAAFDVAALTAKMRRHRPGLLAFVGKGPTARVLGRRAVPLGPVAGPAALPPLFVLPSPSGRACGAWDPAPWHALAARLRDLPA
ncbi:mismatch-specific DNA-glycosylase [Roseicella frigidaeris]|uniref:Mismatch-specific DNA-glycosylase n=1 Tax=Roseicella frigidaeris TaxID=2230885 RepID=A0A327ME62_9PROT|nr:mismatch-specific DNA-glycosylase [Roseicella frigidaeris]RAI60957.1 mismatch-specific DNA-glycosylase [Roseicella frigidaeris]